MCWYSNRKIYMKMRTAEEDIPVFKILTKKSDGKYISPYYRYLYELGKVNESDFDYDNVMYSGLLINEGLHSYSTDCSFCIKEGWEVRKIVVNGVNGSGGVTSFIGYPCGPEGFPVIMDGVIPKGATYYRNELGEIVSNQLIITEEADVNQFEVIKEGE